ncbi:MAG: hypothetical protein COV91_00130 [Candidatus Taylorbacteria bacterium CG11_big_fil_rev_8_21_14_0_20_46_11]|uniref:Uncharacterized protein n=1 Tax=Candidatus Taylorbacteria bacterium CG11_big_fil_rev_8_21_14_0_20_46_11 TaxID=1975025 RepID=A0A2H0KD30_9BACT|nr:MAG: hypothetical protein COV91_00130 [Candidatus Taylorbacteria bacterium CG11_big_fil_rev_8_21_14_0_20_46_11]
MIVELFDYKNGARKVAAAPVLLKTDISAERTHPHFTCFRKVRRLEVTFFNLFLYLVPFIEVLHIEIVPQIRKLSKRKATRKYGAASLRLDRPECIA